MILLTKTINKVLEDAVLSELTVTRSSEGTLQLVGRECGQSILLLSSMPISKKLTVVEREILIEDYIMPLITKHRKDLASLVTLMKDRTIEDMGVALREELLTKEDIKVNTSTAFSYADQRTELSSYSATDRTTGDKVQYLCSSEEYTINLSSSNKDSAALVREMKIAHATTRRLLTALVRWKNQEEAAFTKKEHVTKLQESMQVKCSL